MSEITGYVAYYVAAQQKGNLRPRYILETGADLGALAQGQYQSIQDFLKEKQGQAEIIEAYIEMPDSRRTSKWPELIKALAACKAKHATLLIPELGTLASNENFVHHLMKAEIKFYCLDQPFVNQTILEALSKHAQVQRKLHGKLIREGLKMTSAKSGNPNAAEVIGKVNKPKIDTAIVFACLLQPIIDDYRQKGFSQRQMVKALNEEGFTAPEGGKWVLSQLQKVLDRVRLNEIASQAKSLLEDLSQQNKSSLEIIETLNARGIVSLKRSPWDEPQFKKLKERTQQIQDIVSINQFVLNLLPFIHQAKAEGLSPIQQLQVIEAAGISIRHNQSGAATTGANLHLMKDKRPSLEALKQSLVAWPNGGTSLELALESAAKHIPSYLKIVKGHIDQLAKVLDLETHAHRNLETVGLAEPVVQLIQLFRILSDQDLELLETLAFEAKNWAFVADESVKEEATAA